LTFISSVLDTAGIQKSMYFES